uniref:Transposon Ty3-I Gag-Pol polyprotein n=1 Tax=Cajanus cajan TaxID=3821 RepID=A0A151U2K4_CAJCA|nr:Transposon Ty3-I Gag-Pol polyprotein [Cajanus cajan]
MKFPSDSGWVITIHADHKTARECYFASLQLPETNKEVTEKPKRIHSVSQQSSLDLDPRIDQDERVEPIEDKQPLRVGISDSQVTYLGTILSEQERNVIGQVVLDNKDLFAWHPSDMPGIDPEFLFHKLSISREARPIAQRRRKAEEERKAAIEAEVAKLLDARFIREVHYTTWLANVFMVQKPSGKWRMCTDYTNLNKACPKDAYPLPDIDRLVDGASGHKFLPFLDAYSGYNQIRMHSQDEEKTAFITEMANYCYRVMPFGLKNAGATYQRLMNKIFHNQIGRSMEVYVDDMVVKSSDISTHVHNLSDVFQALRQHQMRLNPEKCVFGVSSGKFLGFMLSIRGIEANPDKCQAVLDMKSPGTLKEVQKLAGRLTSLSRFLPRLAPIAQPILFLLKKAERFSWNQECEESFQQFKKRLGAPPVLTKPTSGLDVVVYLAISNHSVGVVLVQENQGHQQPVYFISRTLQDAERRYQLLEKVALGLIYVARRLRQYFQSHRIVVRTDCPVAKVLRKPEIAGRMMAWSVELSEFDISFEPRGPIKSQHLADFVSELTPPGCFEDEPWTMHVHGSSNAQGSGAGVILASPSAITVEQSLRFGFRASNNQAEYESLIAGMRLATEMGVKKIICWTDSKIVAEQVNDNFQVKDSNLLQYYHLFQRIKDDFTEVRIRHVLRSNNERANQLARLASSRKPGQLRTTIHLEIPSPSVTGECMATDAETPTWITAIRNFIVQGESPTDPVEAKKLRTQAARYSVLANELYRRGFSTPLLKCIDTLQADYILQEIHEGICGSHSGGRTMAAKVLRAGYYWPTLKEDCANFVKKCVQCQKHGNLIHASAAELHSVSSPWPFSLWGIDVLEPFPMAKGQVKVLLVAVDYFTKWIEAKPLACISATNVQKFVWKSLVTRFGIPYAIVSDNGLQFTDKKFNTFLENLGIRHRFTSVEHPQSNGQAEAANKVILTELKKRLGAAKGAWVEELPEVLWAYRCTPQSTTKEPPFRLTYGADAMIPVEVGEPSFRRQHFHEESSNVSLRAELDVLDETREKAQIVAEACKQRMTRRFNSNIKPRTFHEGDLV